MRALVCKDCGSTGDLVVEEVDDPVAGKGEILVDIKAAGLNFPDVLVIGGQYQVKTPPPFIPGHEAAGIVAAVGEGATRFEVGDKVIMGAGMEMRNFKSNAMDRTFGAPDACDFVKSINFEPSNIEFDGAMEN